MTRRRWIADEVHENRAALTGAHAQHLAHVLRARVGQEFDIAASDVVRRGRILSISDSRIEFELGETIPTALLPQITLLLAIFKFDRMEWAIEKCTELGVSRIMPVIARRTDARLASAAVKRSDRWQRLTRQAAEQSRRSAPPEIFPPIKVKGAVQIQAGLRILLAEHEHQVSLTDVLVSYLPGQTVALAIGPEGGWIDDEVTAFSAAGWIPATLGHTILRAETAAIAALAIAQSAL